MEVSLLSTRQFFPDAEELNERALWKKILSLVDLVFC